MLEAVTTTVNDREAAQTANEFQGVDLHTPYDPHCHRSANDFRQTTRASGKEAKPTPPTQLTAATRPQNPRRQRYSLSLAHQHQRQAQLLSRYLRLRPSATIRVSRLARHRNCTAFAHLCI